MAYLLKIFLQSRHNTDILVMFYCYKKEKNHHDQDKKAFNCEFSFSMKLVHDHHGQEHCGRQAWLLEQ